MILLLPIGLLLASSLAITILDKIRPKFGTSWLIASGASIITWVFLLFLRLRLPTTLELFSWAQNEINLMGSFSLLLDYDSWPYVLSLITITLAVILSDAARTRYDSSPQSWAASLMITALGLLALMSGTSLSLMVAWVAVDLYELVYLLRLKDADRYLLRIIISFGVRMTSIMALFLATSLGWQTTGSFTLTEIPQSAGFLFLLAAGLRLGVFPLNLPFLDEPTLRRGAGNIIRLAPVAASLSLLARLPVNLIPPSLSAWMPLFQGMIAFAGLYAAIRWLTAANEIEGRPFWIIGWAALATISVLNGSPKASLAWGIALLLPGSLLFLYYPRIQRMNFLLHFGLIGLIGVPYTLVASGWVGLIANGVNMWTLLSILTHALLVLGYINRTFQPGGETGVLESWARLVYPLGVIIIIQSLVALGLVGWPGSLTLGVWWLALMSNILILTAIILIRRFAFSPPYVQLSSSSTPAKVLNWILSHLEPIFRLEWLYRVAWRIYNFFGGIFRGFSALLEGEGGILWTILLLILLISFLTGGGTN